jgi:8-oxo-dGTP pyrophosphatase MutT (NUDIX family)
MIKKLSSKQVYQNPWMTVTEDQVEFPNNHQGIYGVVHKDDFALIIPFDGTHFYLVQQYRYPVQQLLLEFPQGKNEQNSQIDPLKLAHEELKEETGLVAGKMIKIGFLYEAAGYCNQGFHLYLATELTQSERKLELTEAGMETIRFTPSQLQQAIKENTLVDAPSISAYAVLLAKMPKLLTT